MTPEELLKQLISQTTATPARLAAEPAAPQLVELLSTLHPQARPRLQTLCSRVPAARLCGTGYACVDACAAAKFEEAWLPLSPPPSGYRYPRQVWDSARAAAQALASLSPKGLPPVYHDYRDPLTGRRCEPRIGCRATRPSKTVEEAGEIKLNHYRPIVYIPTLFTWHAWRLTKPRSMKLPWIALCRPGRCKRLLCLEPGGCSFHYDPSKPMLTLEAGRAAVDESASPGAVQAYIDTLLAPVYREVGVAEAVKPVVWVMGPVVPIAASVRLREDENRGATVRLLLWNTSKLPSRSTVLVRGHRIRSALLVSAGDSRRVPPGFDRVNLVLAGHSLAVLVLETLRTLFL